MNSEVSEYEVLWELQDYSNYLTTFPRFLFLFFTACATNEINFTKYEMH